MNMFIIMFVLGIRNGFGLKYEVDKVQSNHDKLFRADKNSTKFIRQSISTVDSW